VFDVKSQPFLKKKTEMADFFAQDGNIFVLLHRQKNTTYGGELL